MSCTRFYACLGSAALVFGLIAAPAQSADASWDSGDDWAEEDDWAEDWEKEKETSGLPFRINGFMEAAAGAHLYSNPAVEERMDKEYNLGEARLRLDVESEWKAFDFSLKVDAVADAVDEEARGELREALLSTSSGPVDWRLGRQVLTWGTGDLLFINDLFPKDWQSFLIGRDEDYLKAPSNAIRSIWYAESVTLDAVWSPLFSEDHYPDGDRLSYYSPQAGGQTAQPVSSRATEPDDFPEDGELALRLATRQSSVEYALYGYWGFWPEPSDQRQAMQGGKASHPVLHVYGASLRTGMGPGLFNAEVGYYDSRDYDSEAANLTPNSEVRLLMGYNWELITHLNLGLQYYLEWAQDHEELEAAWLQAPASSGGGTSALAGEEYRQLLTTRLTLTQWRGDLTWSLFAFVSPSDDDFYLRPSVRYRVSDALTLSAGGNLFGGDHEYSFFGQFEKDSNAYLRARYRF